MVIWKTYDIKIVPAIFSLAIALTSSTGAAK